MTTIVVIMIPIEQKTVNPYKAAVAERCELGGTDSLTMPFQNGFLERLRNYDRQEQALGVEVVFTKFINDPNLTVLECRCVGKGDIELSFFERDGITPVVYAHE